MIKKLLWKIKYARHLKRRLRLPILYCFKNAESALENVNYDLSECPVYCAEEESYCWQVDAE